MSTLSPIESVAAVVGAVSAVAVENLTRKVAPRARTPIAAAGLITAAGIYPAARRGARRGAAANRELAGTVAALALSVVAVRRGGFLGRALVAGGWAAHAAFDAQHDAGPDGRLPGWYPALCASYDLAMAATLLRPNPR